MKNYTRILLFLSLILSAFSTNLTTVFGTANEAEEAKKKELAELIGFDLNGNYSIQAYQQNEKLKLFSDAVNSSGVVENSSLGGAQGTTYPFKAIITMIDLMPGLSTAIDKVKKYNDQIEQDKKKANAAMELEIQSNKNAEEYKNQKNLNDLKLNEINAKIRVEQAATKTAQVQGKLNLQAIRVKASEETKARKENHVNKLEEITKKADEEARTKSQIFTNKLRDLTKPKTVLIGILFGGALVFIYFLGKYGVPYLLSYLFVSPPKIVKETSLPSTWIEALIRKLFGKKKRKSFFYIMTYNDDTQKFVEQQYTITKAIQSKNKNLKKGQSPYKHEHILLYGPPGTGKTLLAKGIGRDCNMDYVFINTALLAQFKNAADAVAQIRQLFDYARQYKTEVVLIWDEFDAIFKDRALTGDDKDQKIINAVLGFVERRNSSKIKMIAITNLFGLIDKAILNRFSTKYVGPPTKDKRVKLLKDYMKEELEKQGVKVSIEVVNAIEEIAEWIDGETGRFIQGMWSSLRNNATFINKSGQVELADVRDYIQRNVRKKQQIEKQQQPDNKSNQKKRNSWLSSRSSAVATTA